VRKRRVGLLLLVAASLIGGCAGDDAAVTPAPATIDDTFTVLDVDGFADLVEDPSVTVVNVHVPYESELPGTDALVAYDQILGWDGLPHNRDAALAVYCMSGNMSRQAALALVEAGYTEVRELDGGMLAWETSGRELITRNASAPPQG
jgi:rhodanese-related sulfurtransferase